MFFITVQVNGTQNEAELHTLFSCPELESLLLETGYSKPLAELTILMTEAVLYHLLLIPIVWQKLKQQWTNYTS